MWHLRLLLLLQWFLELPSNPNSRYSCFLLMTYSQSPYAGTGSAWRSANCDPSQYWSSHFNVSSLANYSWVQDSVINLASLWEYSLHSRRCLSQSQWGQPFGAWSGKYGKQHCGIQVSLYRIWDCRQVWCVKQKSWKRSISFGLITTEAFSHWRLWRLLLHLAF